MEFYINSIIDEMNQDGILMHRHRILWVSEDNEKVVTININAESSMPEWRTKKEFEENFLNGTFEKGVYDPFVPMSDINLSVAQKTKRNNWWKRLENLTIKKPEIFTSEKRGILFEETAKMLITREGNQGKKKETVTVKEIYTYMHRFWVGGQTANALIPNYHKCGAPGKEKKNTSIKKGRPSKASIKLFKETGTEIKLGINLTPEIKLKFDKGIKRYYYKEKLPLKTTYFKTITDMYNQNVGDDAKYKPIMPSPLLMPTYGQFKSYFYKKYDETQRIIAKKGKDYYDKNERAKTGSASEKAIGPGSYVEIDSTPGDIYLVSEIDGKVIGRPLIYIVVDVFSRMIIGIYIGLEWASWATARVTLQNVMTDKVKFCAEHGIPIKDEDWPCRYLPEIIIADNGEMKSFNSDNLPTTLNIPVINTRPYHPDDKPFVEQTFNTLRYHIQQLPGAIKQRDPGDRDYRLDAKLTLKDFTKIIINLVLLLNKTKFIETAPFDEVMLRDNVPQTPIERWKWGVKNQNGCLRAATEEMIYIHLLPKDDATVTNKGIRFKNVYYTCDSAEKEHWFSGASRNGVWDITISFNPKAMDTIYCWPPNAKSPEKCTLLKGSAALGKYSLEEIEWKNEGGRTAHINHNMTSMEDNISCNAKIQRIVDEAKERSPVMSNSEKVGNIRENRDREKTHLEEQAKGIEKSSSIEDNNITLIETKETDEKFISSEERNKQKLAELYKKGK